MTSEDTNEWAVQMEQAETDQLRLTLNVYERESGPTQLPARTLEFLVDKFSGLRVEVFAREHPPPHFRICIGGETANYNIKDCTQLNGKLKRYYPVVRAWHAENKQRLIETWNKRRPTDCPVGVYREG